MAKNRAVVLVRFLALSAMFVLTMLAFSACNDSVEIASDWVAKPIVADGSTADWDNVNTRYFQDQGAVVGVANDSSNLYLLVRFRDPQWVGLIKRTGLKLEFKTEAKDNSPFTLVYRGGPKPEQLRELMGNRGGQDSGDRAGGPPGGMSDRNQSMGEPPSGGPGNSNFGGDQREFTCAIEGRIEEKAIPVDGSEGPRASFSIEKGLFSYELAVPLKEGGTRSYGLGIGATDKFKLKAVWGDPGEMKAPSGTAGGPPGGGMGGMGGAPPGGGMGGGMGGGPPGGGGGMGGPPGGGQGQTQEKQEVTFKIQLAGGAPTEAVSEDQ